MLAKAYLDLVRRLHDPAIKELAWKVVLAEKSREAEGHDARRP